jgi:hypothetical protein
MKHKWNKDYSVQGKKSGPKSGLRLKILGKI